MSEIEKKVLVFCRTLALALGAFLCVFCACAIFSCASIEKMLSGLAAPYAIFDSQIAERDETGIEFTFSNLGERTITRVEFFAHVQETGDSERIFIPLGEFEFDGEIENYFVETLFASEIIFSDGEVWRDKDGVSVL